MKSDLPLLRDVKPELAPVSGGGWHACRANDSGGARRAREAALRDNRGCETHGLTIGAAGTHPISSWQHQHVTPLERYLGAEGGAPGPAHRLLIFGTHVHIGDRRSRNFGSTA